MYIFDSKLSTKNFKKYENHPLAKEIRKEIETRCDAFRNTLIPITKYSDFKVFAESGERQAGQRDYFIRRNRLSAFLLKVWLDEKEEDIAELEDILWAICDEYTWSIPAHLTPWLMNGLTSNDRPFVVDLFASETAQTIAEALSICKNLLSEEVKERCVDEIFRRVIEPFEKRTMGWENVAHNWSAVCGGAVGIAALYLIEDGKRLSKITNRLIKSSNCFFDSCTDDGACLEGLSYWDYAMSYYISFGNLLMLRTGEDMFKDKEKLKRLCSFPSVCALWGDMAINFSDAGKKPKVSFGIMCKMAELFDVPIPEKSYYSLLVRGCCDIRNIAWFNPSVLEKTNAPKDYFLPDAQWAVMRNENQVVALKGGHNDEPHNHNDIGTYIFIKDGCPLVEEIGKGEYSKDYFKEKRYTFINTSSLGHSVPIINGCAQINGAEYRADSFNKGNSETVISFAGAYDKKEAKLEKLKRSIMLCENSLRIRDAFHFTEEENSVTERVITYLNPKVTEENSVELYENSRLKGKIKFLNEGNITVTKERHALLDAFFYMIDFEWNGKEKSMEIEYIVQ